MLEVVAFAGKSVFVCPLAPDGAVVIGRDEHADLRIDDASVSRRHAVVRAGPELTIEDLGSTNCTRRSARRAPGGTDLLLDLPAGRPTPIAPGDVLHIGSAQVVVRRREAEPDADAGRAIVSDPAMRRLYQMAERAASGPISILILGETGAGKEVLAEAIHRASPRAKKPFLRLSCVALSETLLESELFGHEKGAFTGAVNAKPGLLQTAEGGTVFLDEVGELPPSIQAKLLRVIEERKVLRVGGLVPQSIDVRFLAATHRELEAEVARGAFRQDLYFRLNGLTLTIPPLRERPSEIEALAHLFARKASRQLDRESAAELAPETLEALLRHDFPGNIRELRNVIERAVVLCPGPVILPEYLGLAPRPRLAPPSPLPPPPPLPASRSAITSAPLPAPASSARTTLPPPPASLLDPALDPPAPALAAPLDAPAPAPETPPQGLRESIEAHERERIREALERCGGNQTRAAASLGISRRTLVDRMGAYDLPRPRKR